jgi:3',5'-cyclic AMP phosphodiesterase CpdA
VRRRGPLALIGVSPAVPTAPFVATGRLGGEQLDRLAETLDNCGRNGLFRVVMIHHPPVSPPARRLKRLVDGPGLCAVLARHGAELVIHGHDHAHSLIELKGSRGPIPVVGVPSASEAPPGEHDSAGYNLYVVEGEAGAWRCQAISRGLSAGGDAVVEVGRTGLVGLQDAALVP